MQKLKELFRNKKAQAVAFVGTAGATMASPSFAAAGSFDSTDSLAWIAAGVVFAGLLITAMSGLVTLVGAGKKAQRAGT